MRLRVGEGSGVPKRARTPPASRTGRPRALARRAVAVAALALVAFLYYRPVVTYLDARDALARRSAEVKALRAERRALERRLAAQASTPALLHEARKLAFVRPGERLFIVQGIAEWRRAQTAKRARATIGGDG